MAVSSTGCAVDEHPVLRAIDDQATALEARVDPASTGDRAHACGQLAHRERLHHVVVGAELEADDAVGLVAAGRGDDHGHVGVLAQLAQHVDAVAVRQPEIEEDDVDVLRGHDHLAGVDDVLRLDPVALETGKERLGHGRVVLDDQHLHGPIVARHVRDGRASTPGCNGSGRPYSCLTSLRAVPEMPPLPSYQRHQHPWRPSRSDPNMNASRHMAAPLRTRRHWSTDRIISAGLAVTACAGIVGVIGVRSMEDSAAAQQGTTVDADCVDHRGRLVRRTDRDAARPVRRAAAGRGRPARRLPGRSSPTSPSP